MTTRSMLYVIVSALVLDIPWQLRIVHICRDGITHDISATVYTGLSVSVSSSMDYVQECDSFDYVISFHSVKIS